MRRLIAAAAAALSLAACGLADTSPITLPTDDAEAAKLCWPAAAMVGKQGSHLTLGGMAESVYYAAIVAQKLPASSPVMDRVGVVTNTPVADRRRIKANAPDLIRQCRARYPGARPEGETPARAALPRDPFGAAMWCYIAADSLITAMQSAGEVDYAERPRLTQVRARARASLDGLLPARSITTTAGFDAERNRASDQILDMMRLDRIVAVCPAG